ncbi:MULTISPECIES: molybdate ABC transporter permease subunit [Acinetobacter]|uniref:Molybdenum transport system permease n=1 Tax=Acinetobacter ursingii TaxID=108980 RepID=A0A3F3L8I7_9GAMM|nr:MULTISPECIES: molybdate ABC transporter permease subunit [Acinetobacter]ENV77135.1 molybdate ABC transporter, permease [Acinetobacter ursingii DSM 16037 = CIP 107286]ENX46705.1 molybdate ABC transporter, permease [Acinetobacter ursingii NIPH 706]EXD35695.1 molybdate ABC transporter, permease protein [Acinetobacter sp. 479375]MCU4350697.1 molybdate ABC transporter permease subunit [Acinetobacter ursingii]MCU4481199.1 molybdate ABC transporter permease subunit [Acinetobacter ursingii]
MFFSLSAEELEVLKLSCQVAAFSLLVNLIPALFVGWLLARKEFWGKSLFETLVFLPLVLPPVVPGYLLLQVFGNNGILGQYLNAWGLSLAFNWKGAVLAAAVMGFPLFVQSIRLAIELVDQRLEMAAKTLGASGLGTFFSITLPLASSGILVGAILCFCRSLGEFGATITFVGNIAGETRTLPLAMYSLMQQPDTEHQVWRLIILSLSVAFFTLWFAQWFHRYQKNKRG